MSQSAPYNQTPYGQSSAAPPVGPPIGYGTGPRLPEELDDAGLGEALFDLSFEAYATPSAVRIFYAGAVVLTALGVVASLTLEVWGLSEGKDFLSSFLLWGLVGIPMGLLVLLGLRVGLETSLALVRTAQELRHLRRLAGAQPVVGPRY